MKKITIQLNTKSIKDARKYLLNLKKQIPKMQQEFLMAVAHWVTARANNYINLSDIGSLVKDQIKDGWEYEQTPNGVKIINRTEKAVFVEFGVGVVGQSESHPKASAEGYEYNVESPYKTADGTWYFWTNSNELDLPLSAMEDIRGYDDHRGEKGKRIIFGTRGAKGVWYAYNAIVDAKAELAKSGGGEIGKMWEDIKARYIK
jgi:hypothetical protein